MISYKYKFIYIHIPKTGGNSIQQVLHKYSDDEIQLRNSSGKVAKEDGTQGLDVFNEKLGFTEKKHKHATIKEYYDKLGDKIYDFFIFTSVRNPWDRFVSNFYFSKGTKDERSFNIHLGSMKPMVEYLKIDNKIVVTNIIRFENLEEDFANICKKLHIPVEQLPHKNKSIHQHYTKYFDSFSKKVLEKKFQEDITTFKYSFDE